VLARLAAVSALLLLCGGLGFVLAGPAGQAVPDAENPHATKVDRHHKPSRVIFPAQSLPLRFSHEKHMSLDMECVTCHENIDKSVRSADVNLPSGEVCSLCHDVAEKDAAHADPPAACSTCHLGYEGVYTGVDPHSKGAVVESPPPKVVVPAPHLQFNHKVHLDRGVACSQCHANVEKLEVANVDNAFPVMGDCMGCHTGKDAPDECTTCHVSETGVSNRIETTYREGTLKPHGHYRNDAHNENFVLNHAQVARSDEKYCASCHAPDFCVECHNGVAKPVNIHPANFILTHPITARKNSMECSSCHRSQSFCTDCHSRSGIMDLSAGLDTTLEFHPKGWVNSPGEPPMGSHHMFEAQRNIRACASCHEERTCLKCHSARDPIGFDVQRARQVNPHPPDFKSRCNTMAKLNDHACLKCHEMGDPNLLMCR
jgi:hypothetical protein